MNDIVNDNRFYFYMYLYFVSKCLLMMILGSAENLIFDNFTRTRPSSQTTYLTDYYDTPQKIAET